MMTLIRGGDVFAPEPLGRKDILLAGGAIKHWPNRAGSASKAPRSRSSRRTAVMKKQGLNAISVPTDHQLARDWRRDEWNPSPGSLVISDRAMHEYLGLLWYRWRGLAH